ncbi:MAG: CDP-alcohol phosphatidyltransferase family protein, partial [Alphaproteobacteria bacterium]|nr:CDP-alcohol phosphatidyltransferase family protein [Alphaproteobacteria bacterium]
MNIPNLISLGRLAAVPVAVWLILNGRYDWAFWLFVAAGVSDAIDGLIAKQFNAETEVGKFLDPLADKALLVSVYISLGHTGWLPMWLVILVVSRDVMILAGALLGLILMERYKLDPSLTSKINTTAQIMLAALVLAKLGIGFKDYDSVAVMIYVVAATTL